MLDILYPMNNISISNILHVPAENIIGEFGACTILPKKEQHTIQMEVDNLIRTNKERRENKIKLYRSILRNCIQKIKDDNNLRRSETFYKIEEFIYGKPEYDMEECIDFLLIELKKLSFDIIMYDKNTLFISWKYMEIRKRHS